MEANMRSICSTLLVAAFLVMEVFGQQSTGAPPLPGAPALEIPGGPVSTTALPRILSAGAAPEFVVQLTDSPLAMVQGKNAKQSGGSLNAAQQRAYLAQLAQ